MRRASIGVDGLTFITGDKASAIATFMMPANAVNVTATYDAGYTITFDANGGNVTPTQSITTVNGKLVALPTPTRDDYRFDGWYTATSGGIAVTIETAFEENSTLFARWSYIGGSIIDSGDSGGDSSISENSGNGEFDGNDLNNSANSTAPNNTDDTDTTGTWDTNGTVVTTETVINADGSETTTAMETITAEDGSKSVTTSETTTNSVTNADGSVIEMETRTTTETVIDANGNITTTETTSGTETTTSSVTNADGSTMEIAATATAVTATISESSGASVVTETTSESSTVTTSITNTDGSLTATVETKSNETAKITVTDATGETRSFTTETETAKTVETATDASGNVTGTGTINSTATITYEDGTTATEVTEGTIEVGTDEKGTVSEVTTATITMTNTAGSTSIRTEITTAAETTDGTSGTVVEDGEGNTLRAEASVSEAALETALASGEPINVPVAVTPDNFEKRSLVDVKLPAWNHDNLRVAEMPKVEIGVKHGGPGVVAYQRTPSGMRLVKECYIGSLIVPVDSSCELLIVDNTKTFSDVPFGAWYEDNATFVAAREIFNGTGTGFDPQTAMNRAMVAQVIYNYDRNSVASVPSFNDVNSSDWYFDAVGWASSANIVTGADGAYRPREAVTRQDLVTILYRYAKQTG